MPKSLLWRWVIFSQNLRVILRRSTKNTLFIPFRAVTVIRNTSTRPNVSLGRVEMNTIGRFLSKKENSALSEHACQTNHTITRENSRIIITNPRYDQTRCLEAWHINSTPPHWIAMMVAYYRMPVFILSIDNVISGFVRVWIGTSSSQRSPLKKTLDRSVETLGNEP